jgi:hypothetical protein
MTDPEDTTDHLAALAPMLEKAVNDALSAGIDAAYEDFETMLKLAQGKIADTYLANGTPELQEAGLIQTEVLQTIMDNLSELKKGTLKSYL